MSDINNNINAKEKVHFYVPDFYKNAALYMILADFLEHIPQWFYDDFKISAAYGSFPSCIWNGGRVFFDYINRPIMDKVITELNNRGIAVRYTFTNPLIEEKHLNDTFANVCMDAANNGKNEVLVNSPVLEEYIRKNYPDFKVISSTTKCLTTFEQIEAELDRDYYLVVLDSSLNKDERIFDIKKRDRLEVLVDHACRVNCPNRVNHYKEVGRAQLSYTESNIRCDYHGASFEEIMKREHSISREELVNKYIPGGFKHFKLDGRAFTPEKLVDSLLYFMVLPEFRPRMKEIIKKEVYQDKPVW